MNVTIIGNGNMARGIATRVLAGGNAVSLHVRDIEKGEALAADLNGDVTVKEIGSPADDIVVITTHYGEVLNVAEQYEGFAGKTLVDITNPVDFQTFQLIPEAGRAGAQDIADALPNATVVKAFNTIFAGTLVAGTVDGKSLDVFVAGDDTDAKKAVSALINDSDMRAVDAGPLANARHLEGIALIHMAAQEQLGTNWASAIKIVA